MSTLKALKILMLRFCFLMAFGTAVQAADGCGGFPFPAHETTLPNGLHAVVVPTATRPNVISMAVVVATGPRYELEAGKTGLAQVLERLMSREGADAVTSDDYTSFTMTFAKRELGTVLAAEAERFRNGPWTAADFGREARAIQAEYRRAVTNPVFRLFESQRETAFTTHPYRHARFGVRRDVDDLPSEAAAARTFFERWYRPEHTTLVVAGDVDSPAAMTLIEKYWGSWPKGSSAAEVPPEPESTAAVSAHIRWETPTPAWVTVAFRSPAFSAGGKELASLQAAMETWFGPHSALYKRLVVAEEKVEQLGVDVMANADPGLATVYARVRHTKDLLYVRDRILETAARARTGDVPQQRFAAVQSNARYTLATSRDDPAAIATTLARYARFDRRAGTLDDWACTRSAVTAADVRAAAQRYFVDERLVVVTLAHERRPVAMPKLPSLSSFTADTPEAVVPAGEFPVVARRTSSPRVRIEVQFAAGSGRDPVGREGLAQLAASMIVNGGAKGMPIEDAREALFAIVGNIDAVVDKDRTTFTLESHRDAWSRLLDVALPLLLDPALPLSELRLRKAAQQDALQNLIANDLLAGSELLQQLAYHGLPYGHPALGTTDGIDTTTLADVRRFLRHHYTTGNLTVTVTGDVTEALLARLRGELSRLPGGRDADPAPRFRTPSGLTVDIYDKESTTASILLGQAIAVDRTHPDWPALEIARLVLGDPQSAQSRLHQRISAARGLGDGGFAFLRSRRGSVFEIALRPVAPQHTAMALRIAVHELRRLIEDGLTDAELERVRASLLRSAELDPADETRLSAAAIEQLRGLTRADVNRAIREHLHPRNLYAVVIAPDARERRVEILRKTPAIAYASEKPKALRDEDAIIAALDLALEPDDVRLYPITDAFIE